MSDDLPRALRQLLRSDSGSNPALDRLLDDYTRYHVVLVVVGTAFLAAFVVLSVLCWRRFIRAPKASRWRWTFEKGTYWAFGVLSAIVGAFLALVVAANVSTVLDPTNGFAGSIGLLGSPRPGTRGADLHQAFLGWLQSGSSTVPSLVQSSIDDRLAWQRPKAVICTVLLVAFVALAVLIWRRLIRLSRIRQPRRRTTTAALLTAGVLTVTVCLLLMLMVMGNTQGSLAPMSLTLFFG